jgi:hypothetical protein
VSQGTFVKRWMMIHHALGWPSGKRETDAVEVMGHDRQGSRGGATGGLWEGHRKQDTPGMGS